MRPLVFSGKFEHSSPIREGNSKEASARQGSKKTKTQTIRSECYSCVWISNTFAARGFVDYLKTM